MNRRFRWLGRGAARAIAAAAAIVTTTITISALPADADDCPDGGAVRFGVEPFDTAPRLAPVYERVGTLLGEKIGCKVQVFIATSYNAEIEAMRSGKLDIGEFGPLGYVLAHQVAKAEAVAAYSNKEGKPDTYWASIVTYPSSGITTVVVSAATLSHSPIRRQLPATCFRLWLRKAGLDPDTGIKAIYAGSHTAAFEALYNKKVDAGELNSAQLESARQRGHSRDGDLVFLWKSDPIPTDPIAVRGDLPDGFKRRLVEVLQSSICHRSTKRTAKSLWAARDGCHKQTKLMMEFAIW